MSDSAVGPFPQVFVVDSQASCVSVPTPKKARCSGMGQKILFMLMGIAMLGLALQACLIFHLYNKVEAFSHCASHPLCQNVSRPSAPGQQGDALSRVGAKVEPRVEQIQNRPFAQLIGSSNPVGEDNVVQWEHKGGETYTNHMGYSKGQLLVQMEGHYYLYSKVTLNAAEECSLVQHKVMKVTKAYGQAIELMKSKSSRCTWDAKFSTPKSSPGEDLRNSFLAGIFHLQTGDKIYVTLEDIQKIHRGTTDNIMGAFMIAP
ncbi:tumor necrosis factor ligand superfamily member 14-like [Takifugu rubripes]|uniref:Tumor necrosis factor ligand superfamily member 14-like n=1 Tax=Takifugu rubripes TaxID=31033 RepID=A0A3B5K980_TAKRU|nr:tumor necrosis factor ligand superfamily member 14-like [Takifugu rubripes]|eukprot:XP_003972137.1 PREDICTED: tumor necrosis factor ligand superfamily member 14-like [Takifugu rubripes]